MAAPAREAIQGLIIGHKLHICVVCVVMCVFFRLCVSVPLSREALSSCELLGMGVLRQSLSASWCSSSSFHLMARPVNADSIHAAAPEHAQIRRQMLVVQTLQDLYVCCCWRACACDYTLLMTSPPLEDAGGSVGVLSLERLFV